MSVNDPISDMLTRIRNAGMARQAGNDDAVDEGPGGDREDPQRRGLYRRAFASSRSGRKISSSSPSAMAQTEAGDSRNQAGQQTRSARLCREGRDPSCRSGLGIAIVSTPQGVMTGYEARRRGIGGEVLCTVF